MLPSPKSKLSHPFGTIANFGSIVTGKLQTFIHDYCQLLPCIAIQLRSPCCLNGRYACEERCPHRNRLSPIVIPGMLYRSSQSRRRKAQVIFPVAITLVGHYLSTSYRPARDRRSFDIRMPLARHAMMTSRLLLFRFKVWAVELRYPYQSCFRIRAAPSLQYGSAHVR